MKHIQLSLEEAEALAQEIRQRPASGDEHRRPDVLRREDAIVVLWQALVDERKRQPCSHSPANPDSDASTH